MCIRDRYNCKDNLTILIAIQNDREWVKLCKIVLDDESMVNDTRFKTNSDRVTNRELTEKIIQDKFITFDRSVSNKKGSFVIVCQFSFNDKLTIVPTLQEAYDYIEMEEIERQLNI